MGIKGGSGFLGKLQAIINGIGHIQPLTFAIALITLAILILLPKISKKIPAPLVVVVGAITFSSFYALEAKGVQLAGSFPTGLPPFTLPNLSNIMKLLPAAAGIALMSFTESIAVERTFIETNEKVPDANRELIVLGIANVAGGFFKCMPSGGGTSQTVLSTGAGAKTPMAKLVAVGIIALAFIFIAPLIAKMPEATLAALVIFVVSHLVNPKAFADILKIRKREFFWAIAAFAGVIVLGTLEGILVAIVISLATMIYQANHPPVYELGRKKGTQTFRSLNEHPDDETFPELLIIRTEGQLNFASIPRTAEKFNQLIDKKDPKVILVDMSAVLDIEYTALDRLVGFEKKMKENNIDMWLSSLNPQSLEIIRKSPLGEILGNERMFISTEEAVEFYCKNESENTDND